jgi:TolB-like protein
MKHRRPASVGIIAELRRRKVFRVAVVYAATAFAVMQAADVMLPRLGMPDWTVTLVVALTVLGFPLVLVLAWTLDLTPQGLRVTPPRSQADPAAPAPSLLGRRTVLVAVALVLLGVGLGAGWFLRPLPEAPALAQAPERARAGYGQPQVEPSIAVLPFVNLSADPEQAFFSDGIAEELVNALVRLPGLKVAGRSSSFAFRDRQGDLREIGSALGVSHILEGSVRRQEMRVRVTTQLIRTDNGFHLWSETFDRELRDIFAVQDEITAAVVAALQVQLGPANVARVAVADLDAYTLYLEARQRLALRGVQNLEQARALFERAIARDPGYAPAHAGLGRALTLLATYRQDAGTQQTGMPEDMSALAKAAAGRALALDAGNAEAWSVLGTCALWFDWDWPEAGRALEQSQALRPNDPEIVNFLGDHYARVLDRRAEATERRAVELDPLHAVNHHDLALVHIAQRRYEPALEAAATADALGFYTAVPEALATTTLSALLGLGRFEEAGAAAARIEALGVPRALALSARLRVATAIGDQDAAERLLRELSPLAEAGAISPAWMAKHLVEANRPADAASWFRRAIASRDYSLTAPRLFRLPEELPDAPALRAALDTPELNALFELRRRNLRERDGVLQ